MKSITYRDMAIGEEGAVSALVESVFNELIAPDCEEEGITEFFRYANRDAIKERMHSGGFILVAAIEGRLAGILEFTPPDCIAMLFVTIRGQGIAKGLLSRAIARALVEIPSLTKLVVHSSPYAVQAYEKLGFRCSGMPTKENGIAYIPMELTLNGGNID